MELEFIENSKRDLWNDFILENKASFLQSFEWGEFQKGLSKNVWRILVKKEGKISLAAQVIEEKMKFKSYFYIPYGPVFPSDGKDEASLDLLLEELKSLAKKKGVIFLRIEPVFNLPITSFILKPATKRTQPEKTLLVDLDREEEDILKSFEKRTRYNIKLAQRKDIRISLSDHYSSDFYRLLGKTKERQEFRSFPESHYRKLMDLNGRDLKTRIFLIKYKNKPVVATLAVFFGDTATTLHSGFNYSYRDLKAPYLIRWGIMQEAKRMGLKWCDFWGINEKKWPGVTKMKKSFNGMEVEYGEGKEMVFSRPWYFLYNMVRIIL
ncbi:MAG: peptidoglycan bridge formation glycyltransferase FemA/FemB family protein [Candidatus Paceibacterota bacterium]|jgi:lipid II:glycine glycyltransferase (peptidoglycan interpeptide bridge formation enzyme)